MTTPTEPEARSDRQLGDPCPACGMPLDTADAQPTTRGDQTYCCEGCASGADCTCASHGHR